MRWLCKTLVVVLVAGAGSGCALFKVRHEIAPIYATVDVNIRIQRELADVFDFEESRGGNEASISEDGGAR